MFQTTTNTGKATKGTGTQLPAFMADLGGVVRFNPIHANSFSFGFVLDKVLELMKTPIAQYPVKSPALPLLPDVLKVFHNNFVSAEVGNNVFAYVVVYPCHKTSFSPRNLPEKPSGSESAFMLEFCSYELEPLFDLLDFGRIIKPAIRCDGKVVYSEVNAQNNVLRSVVLLSSSNLFREYKQEETSPSLVNAQEAFLDSPAKIVPVAVRNIKFELFSLVKRSDNKCVSFQIGTSWEVIPNRSPFDDGFCLGFFDHAAGLPHAGNCQLGWQFVTVPEYAVDFIVELNVIFNLMFPGIINRELQGFGVSFDSSDYLWSGINTNFSSNYASHMSCKTEPVFKLYGGEFAFLPT